MAAKMFNVISIVLLTIVLMLNGRFASALIRPLHHHHRRHKVDAGLEHHHHHEVGGALAWTPLANPQKWASEHTFHVGDTIGFKYPKGEDSVVLVDRLAYHTCNSSSPLASFRTGNDAITFKRKGHYFFISGVEDHCKCHGQKFNVRIPRGPHSSTAAEPQGLSLFFIAISIAAIVAVVLVLLSLFRFLNLTKRQSCPNSPV